MKTFFLFAFLFAGVLASAVIAQDAPEKESQQKAPLTVAVLSFDASDPSNKEMGVQLSEMATVALSGNNQFSLVDRTSLRQTLAENELSLTGMIDATQAIQVGKLIGAKILVTGRAFKMGRSHVLTAKIIGTETSRVSAVMVKGGADSDLGELAMQLAEQIDICISKDAEMLTGADLVQADPLPSLIKALSEKKDKPVIAVVVTEEHIASPTITVAGGIPDPAVETELKRILLEAGFEIKDVPQNELADWSVGDDWPKTLEGVDFVITGEALSEFSARIGNLVSCTSRAEINMINRATGKIVVSGRATTRAVDLAENVAGKTALQKAGRELAIDVLEHFKKSE